MFKLLSLSALALAIAGAPGAAEARTDVSIGIALGPPAVVVPGPIGYRAGFRGYDTGDIRLLLVRQGYRVDYVDRRGDSYYVRAFYGPEIYQGWIGCYDGRWIRRERVGYVRGWDRDQRWRGDRDRDHGHDRDHDHGRRGW